MLGLKKKDMKWEAKPGPPRYRVEESKVKSLKEQREWKYRDHALFIGFAPLKEPRYAISVIIDHGESGSQVAAPFARDVLLDFQKRQQKRQQEKLKQNSL